MLLRRLFFRGRLTNWEIEESIMTSVEKSVTLLQDEEVLANGRYRP